MILDFAPVAPPRCREPVCRLPASRWPGWSQFSAVAIGALSTGGSVRGDLVANDFADEWELK